MQGQKGENVGLLKYLLNKTFKFFRALKDCKVEKEKQDLPGYQGWKDLQDQKV